MTGGGHLGTELDLPTAPLGEIAQFINGGAFSPADWEPNGSPIIRIQNLTDPGKPFNRTTKSVPTKLKVHPGDLLVSWSATLGVFRWPSEAEVGVLNQHIFRVLPAQGVHKQYLFHMLHSAIGSMGRHLHGATMKHINRAEFLGTRIPLPPIEEQRRIATVLDQADELRAKRHAAIALLDTLTDSIFLDMFGDPVTNPMGWPVVALGDAVAAVQIGPFGSLLHKSDYVEDGIPLVNPMHISAGRIVPDRSHGISPAKASQLGRYVMHQGDVVMGRRGEMGRCAVVQSTDAGKICGSGSLIIRPDQNKAISEYLQAILSSRGIKRSLERQAQGVTMPNLNSNIVEGLSVQIPPVCQQERYRRAVDETARLRERIERSASELDNLFAALQHRAFRGEL